MATFVEHSPVVALDGLDMGHVQKMTEDEATQEFCRRRWPPAGEPRCPKCGLANPYHFASRRRYKCRSPDCHHQFTPTSGTLFHGHKIGFRDLLMLAAYRGAMNQNAVITPKACMALRRRVLSQRREKGDA